MFINIKNAELKTHDAYPLNFQVHEGLSEVPAYELTFQSPDADIDLSKLLGQAVEINIEKPDKSGYREFFAYIIGGQDDGQLGEKYLYKLQLSTWLWFLTQNKNSKIYQKMDVIAIIKDVFSRYQVADYKIKTREKYPQREYCVQFNESDFNFVNRLLEYEGIWYFFEHQKGAHTLFISDEQNFSPLTAGADDLEFIPDGEEHRGIREGIQRINRDHKVSPDQVVLRDYDYLEPKKNLHVNVAAGTKAKAVKNTPLEWYNYAQNYIDPDRGKALAEIRLQEMTAYASLLSGESNTIGIAPGRAFKLKLHPDSKKNTKFKVINSDYTFLQDGPDSSSSKGRNIVNRFTVLDATIPYRPQVKTPKPKVSGSQSATVVGPVKSEVHTDKHGRIRVHFHWDRYKTTEEDCSRWLRVIQAWGGKGWGVLAMPRVGQEVLVNYVDGDIDRPMVMGIVYNGDNPPPYELPKHINYSGMVSRSLEFGGVPRANLFTMDDQRGNERLMLHAERDSQGITERNDAKFVGQDLYEVVKRVTTRVLTAHFKFQDYAFSATGVNNAFVGITTSHAGIALSTTGISVKFTGSDTNFTGISTYFTGMSTSFTGMSVSFTGKSTSFTGQSTNFVGSSSSFVSDAHSVTGSSESYTGTSMSTTGSSVSTTGSSISTTGTSMSTTGSSVSVTGSSISTTGSSISTTGSSISTTGSSISTTGSSISTTGSSISTTGSSISTTGSSISNTGLSKSNTGVSISFTGVAITKVGVSIKL